MSERNRVGLSKRVIFGSIVAGLISILILSLIFFDSFEVIISEIKGCSDIRDSFSVKSACNLNENEVKVNIIRGADNINIVRMKFEFQPSDSLWKVDGTKCLDVRLDRNKYGDYCELIDEERENSYVLNLSLGLQKSVKVWIKDKGRICRLGKVEVGEKC